MSTRVLALPLMTNLLKRAEASAMGYTAGDTARSSSSLGIARGRGVGCRAMIAGRGARHATVTSMDRKAHWDEIYATTASDAVSWFQPEPSVSLRLLDAAGMTPAT